MTPLESITLSAVILAVGVPIVAFTHRRMTAGDPITRLAEEMRKAMAPQTEERARVFQRLDDHERRITRNEQRLRRLLAAVDIDDPDRFTDPGNGRR